MARKQELVGMTEIAERLHVRRQRVWEWTEMPRVGFPEPLVRLGLGPVWDWRTVAAWYDARTGGRGARR